ncbi:MAG: extracellular solute-binding protein [Treponema sp.]|jgi:putative aldouronate transport system substrate-binding protein|nr:extracellular solute-binding protein [Treponema sp.]
MKNRKKGFIMTALFLAVIMLVCGCAKKTSGDAAQNSGAPKTVDYTEHEQFTVWLYADPYDQYADYSENPSVWALNKKFNVTLKFEQPVRGTETDSLSLMFGTGEYTDMIEMSRYTGSIPDLLTDGVIINIAQYLDYMPNFKRLLETDDGFRRTSYDDDGHILTLKMISDPAEYLWSGLVYRYDILEQATNGNVRFPSGNDYPKTIADWEYMLPIFKSYFESRRAADYAPLILPFNGAFVYGELLNTFGAVGSFYVDGATVKFGYYDEPLYKYLKKMREWYEKGYIYKDFASRVNDPFYLPNTALTYGGNAGIWYGLVGQLGPEALSMPQYGINVDVRAIPSPLSTEDGITEFTNYQRNPPYQNGGVGWAITKACKNPAKLLSVLDYLYSKEGEMIRAGLTKETGSAENPYYVAAELQDGMYWFENGEMVVNPVVGTFVNWGAFFGNRLPGIVLQGVQPPETLARSIAADKIWDPYPVAKYKSLPMAVSRTSEEEAVYSAAFVRLVDYANSTIPQFIMGTLPLNDQTWADFMAQLKNLGMEDVIKIQQAAYDRYLKR